MDLSVVVPTLNARDELAACLDSLTEHAPGAELVVVNGPSADGTTGMVRERDDVDVLVELADRTINAARNAGIDRASGDAIAFVDHTLTVSEGWADAVRTSLDGADAVTGPTGDGNDVARGESLETRTIAGREVTYFNAGNAAFDRGVLDALDGFDEYLEVGGSRDLAHRLAGNDYSVSWAAGMATSGGLTADGGSRETDRQWKYQSLAYSLVKNHSLRPAVLRMLCSRSGGDAVSGLRGVLGGDRRPSWWLGTGRDVLVGLVRGSKDGLVARRRDRTSRRNPRGRSSRADRAVTVYDWR